MGDIPVRVAVRVRPFNVREQGEGASSCVSCYEEQNQIDVNGKMFAFNHVFDVSSSQESIYDACAAPMLENLFKGYNCTLLAYGQTGSGKTYTMGTEETSDTIGTEGQGIIARMVAAIYDHIGDSQQFSVNVSMLELYEEQVFDLLANSRDSLPIREMKGSVFVQGLSQEQVSGLQATMGSLERGCHLRSRGETAMNETSSRSHAIFTLTISNNGDGNGFTSKLHLVDLAGSERLKKTQSEGERLREGIKINGGLLALGNVIAALSEPIPPSGIRHIPYRDSKITRLLQDSLGGNSYTVMIACVSPADTNAEETLSTLRYADRTKKIKNKPIVNIDPKVAMIEALKAELAVAQHENAMLRAGRDPVNDNTINSDESAAEIERLGKELNDARESLRHVNINLAEAIFAKSNLLEQLSKTSQANDALKERLRTAFEGRANESELMEMLKDEENVSEGTLDDQLLESTERDKMEEEEGEDGSVDKDYYNYYNDEMMDGYKQMMSIFDEIQSKTKAYESAQHSGAQLEKMRKDHQTEVDNLRSKLVTLETERTELLSKLKGSSNCHKVSEERRQRLAELEKQREVYRKKMRELERVSKEKDVMAEHEKKLTQELSALKKMRVKLAKDLRQEETKFRKWKTQSDLALGRIKDQAKKRECQAARQTKLTTQQLAVYRRKYEEASACNKRLQQQLLRGSNCRNGGHKDGDQLIAYLDGELDIALSTAEARWHCEVLIEQRKTLAGRLKLKKTARTRLDREPPRKKRTGSNGGSVSNDEEKRKLDEEIAGIQQEIDLLASEIHDLQMKCVNSDDREGLRWTVIGSISSAKIALKHLFDAVVNQRRSSFEKEQAAKEQKRSYDEARSEAERRERELRDTLKMERDNVQSALEQQNRREVDFFDTAKTVIDAWDDVIERNPGTVDVSVIRRLEKVAKHAQRLGELQNTVQEQSQQIESLKSKLAGKKSPKRERKKRGSKRRSEEVVDESILEDSIPIPEPDDNDESYMPTPDRRRAIRKAKRSNAASRLDRRRTFVVDDAAPSTSKQDEAGDHDDHKENNDDAVETVPVMNATFTKPKKEAELDSFLSSDYQAMKTKRPKRRMKVAPRVTTPERKVQIAKMFDNIRMD